MRNNPENNFPFPHIGHFSAVALEKACPTESGGAIVMGRESWSIVFRDLV
jgi:hypothetical protein